MVAPHNISSLLHSLYQLYHRIGHADLQKRLDSVRRDHPTGSDIESRLTQHVDKISALSKPAPAKKVRPKTDTKYVRSQTSSQTVKQSSSTQQSSKSIFSAFMQYLKHEHSPNERQPYLAENLRKSTWEHINSAVRLAREGNAEAAKMHVKIANQAMHEAAKYMTNDDYDAFALEVSKALDKLAISHSKH